MTANSDGKQADRPKGQSSDRASHRPCERRRKTGNEAGGTRQWRRADEDQPLGSVASGNRSGSAEAARDRRGEQDHRRREGRSARDDARGALRRSRQS